ncbi:MAG: S41 family peptidase [Patescibacteria group bacterium]
MNRSRWTAAGVLAALAIAFSVGLYTGVSEINDKRAAAQTTLTAPPAVNLTQFWSAWNALQDNFVQVHASTSLPTDEEKLYGAIAGLAASYGDPYTVFLPPSDAQVFNDDISGSFGGVGMDMGQKDGNIVVVAPLKGSPAEAAGVRSGDIVVAVDATSTAGMAVDQAVKIIRGPKGTPVTLTLQREGVRDLLKIKIVRDTINIPVINAYARGDGVFVIELYSFSQNSAELFRNALRQFFISGQTKMILDLRGDPGGYLDAAVNMASYFLPVGDTVVTEDFMGKTANVVHRSTGYNVFVNKKLSMAILVDQGSASASEILAGALQQHGVAKLVGTRTFGKGSVQQLVDLGGGAELKVTVARWLTPDGTSISDGGLTPDIRATTTAAQVAAGKDPQKDAAIAWLATQ